MPILWESSYLLSGKSSCRGQLVAFAKAPEDEAMVLADGCRNIPISLIIAQ
jgi:hypothetical protein